MNNLTREELEDRLREIEADIRAVFEQSSVAQAQLCAKTELFVRVNPKFCEMTGYSFEELAKKTLAEITFADDKDADAAAIAAMLNGESGFYENEKRFVRKDGEIIWVHLNATLLRDADGNPDRTMAVMQDITERKKAETELQSGNDLLATLLQTAPVGFCCFDRDLRYVCINKHLAEINGISVEAHIGRHISEILPAIVESVIDVTNRVLTTGKAVVDNEVFGETPAEPGVTRSWDSSWYPVFDGAGEVSGFGVVVEETTEKKLAETKLRANEELYRATIAHAPVGIAHVGLDGRWLTFNDAICTITGYTREKLGKLTFAGITHPDDVDRDWTQTRDLLAGKFAFYSMEKRYIREDGETVWVNLTVSLLRDAQGVPEQFISVLEDITERKSAEEDLKHKASLIELSYEPILASEFKGNIVAWNQGCEKLYGYSAEEAIGRQSHELLKTVHPLPIETLIATLERDGTWTGELHHTTKDGREVLVESRYQLTNTNGRQLILETNRDITERMEAEEGMRISEIRYRRLFESAQDGILILDGKTGQITDANPYILEALGLTEGEALGLELWEIGVFSDAKESKAAMSELQERDYVRYDDLPLESKSGRRREVEVVANAYQENGNRVIQCNIRDITERKQIADLLQKSQQFTSQVLDNLFAFVGVLTLDGTLTEVNRGPLEAAGIEASEVVGKKFWDCHWWNYAPEIQAQVKDACERALSGELVRFDVPVRMTGDTIVWIDFQIAPLRDSEGRITHLIPSAMDISVRRDAEQTMSASEERIRLATEATDVGIWEWNVLTNVMRWDTQVFRIYGVAPSANGLVTYEDWSGAVLPEDLAENERILQHTITTGIQSRREFRIRRRDDGKVRVIESVETTRTNEKGQIEWVIGTNLDITYRKNAENHLRQLTAELSDADRRKDEFLATLAHELRNPLAPIRNGLELMKLAGGQSETIELTRSMMDRQLKQMVRLIDDLMDVSRINRGSLELRIERISLEAVVDSAIETCLPLIKQMSQELTVNFPKEPIMVDADMTRLAQVFVNLLGNAAKYSENGGGNITLVAELEADGVLVTVKDTGIGIAADQLPHIFEMFKQVDRSLEKSHGGLGIGLTLVRSLVELHGGRVDARSEGPGMGSEFAVTLPLAQPTVADSNPITDQADDVLPSGGFRILVVDDNVDSADSLALLLQMHGNETQTANDGEAGVAMFKTFNPHVAVMDIGMPKMNGFEAARAIRSQALGKSVVLIAMTGWGQEEDRRRSKEAGFDHHILKPVDSRALMELLAGLKPDQTSSQLEDVVPEALVSVISEANIFASNEMIGKYPDEVDLAIGPRILIVDDNVDLCQILVILLNEDNYTARAVHSGKDALKTAESFLPEYMLIDLGLPDSDGLELAKEIRKQPWGKSITLILCSGRIKSPRSISEAGFDASIGKPFEFAALKELLIKMASANGAKH